MTTAPMPRSAINFIAAVTSAVGSIVTTSPRLLAKMFLTIMIASLPVVAGRSTIPGFDHDPPQGRLVQERDSAVQCPLSVVKRTSRFERFMSAFDPKRTFSEQDSLQ